MNCARCMLSALFLMHVATECAYDIIPVVISIESGIGVPSPSSAGRMSNACNVDETIEKSVLSLKKRPGQILGGVN